ncbi:ABC transporter ATP-binding protein [Streptomyces sp. NBRC 109706]|uniref:ABC transporter ATP-binding protein n=1 Tax=Streptomyces sp. NBRC 109706 TaxID=1550035 RepID=UPI0007824DBE|nr:ABC transporter ATP-binding protein [Streptomyces sp. NBRC 109706]
MEINVRNLTVKFGSQTAVNDLSIDIEDGEMLVLLGPSGCGKTTTMRSLVGLETPTAGSITIGDETVFDAARGINVPTNARHVGMVFQSYAIWPHMTVYQNVAFPLRMQKLSRSEIRPRVEEVLETVGLTGFAERGASMLSGGQMQRVALARSLVMRPRMLLLDEPLSNLDAKLREKLRYELRELQQSLRMTAIYVTHDQSEALALADRIAVMSKGEIVQAAGPVEMYKSPRTSFVADFLGVDNIYPAETVEQNTGADTGAGEGEGGPTVVAFKDSTVRLATATEKSGGQSVFVCIRPEDVRLDPDTTSGTTNSLPATVVSASFLGDHTRYHLSVDGGPSLYVMSPGSEAPLAAGARVLAHIPREKVQLLDE